MRKLRMTLVCALVAPVAVSLAPTASAINVGNYDAYIDGRYDFHTWIWGVASCNPPQAVGECAYISANPMPVAKAFAWYGKAYLNNGTYTLTVDVPDGLRCGNVYYGPVIPTHDVYTFDAKTLTGKLESSFDVGCDNAPGGTFTYPFRLVRL